MAKAEEERHTCVVRASLAPSRHFAGAGVPRRFSSPSLLLGIGLAAVAGVVAPGLGGLGDSCGRAAADVRFDVHESSWAAGPGAVTVETRVRTWVRGEARRIENELAGAASDSAIRATRFAQIDRLDRDSSYFLRPLERAYIPVPYAPSRAQNRARTAAILEAQARGTAPRDTLAPVVVTDLPGARTFGGIACRGKVLELTFSYRDTAANAAPGELVGILRDTVWLAPPGSPLDDVVRFERDHARATAADSLLAAGNAVQLAQQRGFGLVALLQRARRALPGAVIASHFVNLLRGLPRGMSGIELAADGSAVVQRTVRTPLLVVTDPLPDSLFVPPADYRRAERGSRAERAGRGEKAPPPP